MPTTFSVLTCFVEFYGQNAASRGLGRYLIQIHVNLLLPSHRNVADLPTGNLGNRYQPVPKSTGRTDVGPPVCDSLLFVQRSDQFDVPLSHEE